MMTVATWDALVFLEADGIMRRWLAFFVLLIWTMITPAVVGVARMSWAVGIFISSFVGGSVMVGAVVAAGGGVASLSRFLGAMFEQGELGGRHAGIICFF